MLTFFLVSGGSLWLFAEFVLSLLEKMQTQEILKMLRLPELGDLGLFLRSLSATTLVSMGAVAAILTYWFTHRPKALPPPCDLLRQSEEVEPQPVTRALSLLSPTADLNIVIVDKPEKAVVLLQHVEKKETPMLKMIIVMDPFEETLRERAQECGVVLKSMQAVEDCGQANHRAPVPPNPDDLSIVCFTSGTTGIPKGAMLTHGNVVADFSGFLTLAEVNIVDSLMQASLGGNVRVMVLGAAPSSPTVLEFLRAVIGCQFYEGYGQTECTAGCTFTTPGDWTSGHVGVPLPCNHVKLVDVEELNYWTHNGEGEDFLVAIVVPDPEVMPSWAQKKGFEGTYDELCANKDVKQAILDDLVRLGKEGGLCSFEQVKAIHIHCDMFSVENDLLTPTLKAKRPQMREYFKTQLEELYSVSI
ncbi:PREDICTED: long-chain-fatty-acid--CoA ligase 6-like [Elephantulus edwardii]|uniref:long-chain-fatty-acid--CoA ligase 6-like n=1 Tax=Elephantulus edwardii TaxID=28737 RepID=UPI0003F08E9A|nr:PREDICTED: long-chain-fatty-acid--CoA ligase 6-like [Elephantulus edwardii]